MKEENPEAFKDEEFNSSNPAAVPVEDHRADGSEVFQKKPKSKIYPARAKSKQS